MSTLKTTNIQNPNSASVNIELGADGSVVLPAGFTGGLGTNVVQTQLAAVFSTTSATYVDVLTASITPTFVTSKILVVASIGYGDTSLDAAGQITISKGGTNLIVPTSPGTNRRGGVVGPYDTGVGMRNASYMFLDSPATTSSVQYEIQAAGHGDLLYINRAENDSDNVQTVRGVTTLTLIEVAA